MKWYWLYITVGSLDPLLMQVQVCIMSIILFLSQPVNNNTVSKTTTWTMLRFLWNDVCNGYGYHTTIIYNYWYISPLDSLLLRDINTAYADCVCHQQQEQYNIVWNDSILYKNNNKTTALLMNSCIERLYNVMLLVYISLLDTLLLKAAIYNM